MSTKESNCCNVPLKLIVWGIIPFRSVAYDRTRKNGAKLVGSSDYLVALQKDKSREWKIKAVDLSPLRQDYKNWYMARNTRKLPIGLAIKKAQASDFTHHFQCQG